MSLTKGGTFTWLFATASRGEGLRALQSKQTKQDMGTQALETLGLTQNRLQMKWKRKKKASLYYLHISEGNVI